MITPRVAPVKESVAVHTGLPSQPEPPAMGKGENLPNEEARSAQDETATGLIQTVGGFNPYGGQVEEHAGNQEANNIPSAPESVGSEQRESSGNKDEPSMDSP